MCPLDSNVFFWIIPPSSFYNIYFTSWITITIWDPEATWKVQIELTSRHKTKEWTTPIKEICEWLEKAQPGGSYKCPLITCPENASKQTLKGNRKRGKNRNINFFNKLITKNRTLKEIKNKVGFNTFDSKSSSENEDAECLYCQQFYSQSTKGWVVSSLCYQFCIARNEKYFFLVFDTH